IHDHGVVRLPLHELVFDLPDRLQAKFLRIFGANRPALRASLWRHRRMNGNRQEFLREVYARLQEIGTTDDADCTGVQGMTKSKLRKYSRAAGRMTKLS